EALGLGGKVVVDVLRPEHGSALVLPLLLAEAVLDAPLAIAEPPLYPGLHLKYLHVGMVGKRSDTPIHPEMPRYFKYFPTFRRPGAGDTLVQGLEKSMEESILPCGVTREANARLQYLSRHMEYKLGIRLLLKQRSR